MTDQSFDLRVIGITSTGIIVAVFLAVFVFDFQGVIEQEMLDANERNAENDLVEYNYTYGTVTLSDGETVEVTVVDDAAERAMGLGFRSELAEGEGMLFLSDKRKQSFWMKNMQFSIDIIWIDGDTVVGFEEALPFDSASMLIIYESPEPVDNVLEVSAGFVEDRAIKVGDVLDIALSDE